MLLLLIYRAIEKARERWLTSIGKVSVGKESSVKVMGVINVSPESFYKKSVKTRADDIAKTAQEMQENGANVIDIGAMSTAPYLETMIPVDEEIRRMKEAIEAVKNVCRLPISVDTPRAAVAQEAIAAGVDAINDVTGLKYDNEMADLVLESGLPVIAGSYSKSPATGRMSGTLQALKESLAIAKKSKIQDGNVIVDPSIGFFRSEGKSPFFTKMADLPWYVRDIEVISKLEKLRTLSKPICVSISGKSFMGNLLKLEKADDRIITSVACEIVAVMKGANLIRTHNVKETVQALTILQLLQK